ncbi:MAG: IS256 family transposase [Deltaproteobacteria bacterium]|nr:IS256 family transposase [Deltaproteobacteria bacterium]
MGKCSGRSARSPEKESSKEVLEEILREGARRLLQAAIENEVTEYLERYHHMTDAQGHRLAVRNGYLPMREIITGLGPLPVRQPRVDDRKLRRQEYGAPYTARILPRYLRRIPSIDNLIPALYLKGISTGDFPQALSAILGPSAKGLSPTNIVRLKSMWEEEYHGWSKRDLSDKEYVYFWADGIYFNVRLDDDRVCILVIMGADKEGNKELVAVSDGYRESTISWREVLLDLRRRGLQKGPHLSIADGGLGYWAALAEVFPQSREQRCWVHKTANILDKLPKSMQSRAKAHIHDMYRAESKHSALSAYDHFVRVYTDKYPKAVACLEKDKDVLFTFYDFPAAHWIHIRTTNPIESTFATVRHRTRRTKGCGSRTATVTMVFKLVQEAQKTWKKLKGYNLISLVLQKRVFIDGELQEAA